MKLEDQVCSLELSEKLKELGVKQESLFWYTCFKNGTTDIHFQYDRKHIPPAHYSAFTVAELSEMMPATLIIYKKFKEHWECVYEPIGISFMEYEPIRIGFTGKNEADVRAKMLIYAIENDLIF